MTDNEQDKLTNEWLNIVNKNHDYEQIVKYIQDRYPNNLSVDKLKKIAECLVQIEGYNKEQILVGETDKKIALHIKNEIAKNNSVLKDGEKKVEILLKTKKKKVSKKIVSYLILGAMSVSGIAMTTDLIDDYRKSEYINDTLGVVVADKNSDEYKYKKGIVSQNTYRIGVDKNNKPLFAYSPEGIAKDILEICKKDEDLLDVCLYNVYNDMTYDTLNNLQNMDDVIYYLNCYIDDLAGIDEIKEKLVDCEVFLDYLVKRGFVNPNDPSYYSILSDINKYREIKHTSSKMAESLSEDSQKRIKGVINNYKDNLDNLYNEYKDDLAKLNEEESFGGR